MSGRCLRVIARVQYTLAVTFAFERRRLRLVLTPTLNHLMHWPAFERPMRRSLVPIVLDQSISVRFFRAENSLVHGR